MVQDDLHEATYCPEDNKLRLYVGRVPRDEYMALRDEGWCSTPKQECDFVATWTPGREDMALAYAGYIGDEDQSPEDRAADRAERFAAYRDNRLSEAHRHAERFDAGPAAHGHQSRARAERAARRHDRQRLNAVTQWHKAEYWQSRTERVIRHALHKSSAKVRRGRILRIEAEQRKHTASIEEAQRRYDAWQSIADEPNAEQATARALALAGNSRGGSFDFKHPRDHERPTTSLYSLLNPYRVGESGITGHEAAALYLSRYCRPEPGRWARHYELRLAYEKQMLAAEGGMSGDQDIVPGGRFGGHLIIKVHKSRADGRVKSVKVQVPRVDGWVYQVSNVKGCDFALAKFEVERHSPDMYTPPTDEDLAELKKVKRTMSAAKRATNASKPKLINPSDEDAERLQAALNAKAQRPAEVTHMTQSQYSAASKGSYSQYRTEYVFAGPRTYQKPRIIRGGEYLDLQPIFKMRTGPASGLHGARSVIVLTDKPQKATPDWSPADETQTQEANA